MNKPARVIVLERYLKSAFPPFIFNYGVDEDKKPYDDYITKVAGEIYFNFILEKEIEIYEQDTNS